MPNSEEALALDENIQRNALLRELSSYPRFLQTAHKLLSAVSLTNIFSRSKATLVVRSSWHIKLNVLFRFAARPHD